MRRIRMWGLLAMFLLAASAPAAADVAINDTNLKMLTYFPYMQASP